MDAQHGTDDVAFQLYGPDTGDDGRYGDDPSVDVPQVVQDIAQK